MQDTKNLKSNWDNNAPSNLTIGGQAFDPRIASDDDILRTIKALPGNFEDRNRISTNPRYTPTHPASEEEMAAYDADSKFNKQGDFEQLRKSIEHYLSAAETYKDMGLLQPAANMYSLAAQGYKKFPYNVFEDNEFLSEKAITIFEKAIELHEQQGHEDFSYRDRDKMYDAIAETVFAYRSTSKNCAVDISEAESQEREARYYTRLTPEASKLLHSSKRIQGTLDDTALSVQQKEFGISDGQCIGTDNVGQCVTLIVRSCGQNGELEKPVVALAHIDYKTQPETIDHIFEQLPAGPKQARIFGARFDQYSMSVENLVAVVKTLATYDVDIIASNIHQGNQGASAAIVSPRDFSIRESVPMADNDGMAEASFACNLVSGHSKYPLRLAFDTRDGGERAPLHLTQFMVREIRENYLGKDDVGRYLALQNVGFSDKGLSTRTFSGLVSKYEKAIEDIMPYASKCLPRHIIEDMPVYIGGDALDKNMDIVDEILRAYQQGENISEFDYEARMSRDNVAGTHRDFPVGPT